jgi:hypothetical protein
MKRRSWKELISRVSGISISGLGSVSWVAGPNERKISEEVITYIEDQGIFSSPFEWEHPKETYVAAGTVRTQLTAYMQKLNRDMESFAHFDTVRKALQAFQRDLRTQGLSTTESKSEMSNEQVAEYDQRLVRLRNLASFG